MRWRNGKGEDAPPPATPSVAGPVDASVGAAGPASGAPTSASARTRPAVDVNLGVVDPDQLATAVRRLVARALAEDLGHRGDVTSATTIPVDTKGRAHLVARDPGVVAGLAVVTEVCAQVDPRITVELLLDDGACVERGDIIAEIIGPLRTVLTAERTLLNIVCQLSGVATHTRAFAELLQGTDCVVRDTRKTTPGLRLLEKAAVAAGGGANHRIGLYDAILVKDNHVAAAGGITEAATAALRGAPVGVPVQVEVTSVDEAVLAIEAGVTDLLLDNFTPDALRAALVVIDGRAAVEASGGITLATARAYAEAGADRLAVGALTHSAPALDLALDVVEVTRGPTPPPSVAAATPPATSAAAPADVPSGDAAASSDWEG